MKAALSKVKETKNKVSKAFFVACTSAYVTAISAAPAFATYNQGDIDWGAGGDILDDVTSIISTGVSLGGAGLALFGLINVGIAVKDSNGPGIQQGVIAIVGGLIVVAGGLLFGNLELA